MSRPLVVLRPEPGCSATVEVARALGLSAIASPLFAIEPVAWEVPDPGVFDGLLAGSANAFRQGGPALARLTGLPVLAVGERTADAARAAGFFVEMTGLGGLQAIVDKLAPPRDLLRLAGEARIDLSAPTGISLAERVVYRAVPEALAPAVLRCLADGAVAALHSGESALRFAEHCDRQGLSRNRIAIAALAPRIAEAAGSGWQEVRVAPQMTDAALLAMAADMCH